MSAGSTATISIGDLEALARSAAEDAVANGLAKKVPSDTALRGAAWALMWLVVADTAGGEMTPGRFIGQTAAEFDRALELGQPTHPLA